MSGCSYDSPCPNCEENMDCYTDHKPHEYVSGQCLSCGFEFWTTSQQMDLETLNELRENRNEDLQLEGEDRLEPLKNLPKLQSWLKN